MSVCQVLAKASMMAQKKVLYLALLLALASLASACSADPTSEKESISEAEASSREAFLKIREADSEGGNVSALAERFNRALELLEEARALANGTSYEQASALAQEASQLFNAISIDAVELQKRAAEEASNRRTFLILSAPVAIISITLISYFSIMFWRKRSVRRIMEMKVEEVR